MRINSWGIELRNKLHLTMVIMRCRTFRRKVFNSQIGTKYSGGSSKLNKFARQCRGRAKRPEQQRQKYFVYHTMSKGQPCLEDFPDALCPVCLNRKRICRGHFQSHVTGHLFLVLIGPQNANFFRGKLLCRGKWSMYGVLIHNSC